MVAGRDGLQLQGDIGRDDDDRDDRHQPAEQLALPVPRGDEIGDGCDAVALADAQDLPHHRPPQHGDQRRPEIDRQEVHAARRRPADAAIEGPRRAVDGDRERVDIGAGDDAAAGIGALVAPICDLEQKAQIAESGAENEPGRQHDAYYSSDAAGSGTLRSRSLRLSRSMISASSPISTAHTANRYRKRTGTPAIRISVRKIAISGGSMARQPNRKMAIRRSPVRLSLIGRPPSALRGAV